ncbi:alpha-glucosidase/alpha-galactosidase [Kamptonema cortianum]|nr:alpha-glucosidase/alpha-galactosidase [Kamptonema cortianum]MDL5048643.1 alpha-glucosidase/alpha-galactosidase [Oscillatoria amoena NRMC-F 0135]
MKITFIGAGSVGFTRTLIRDLLTVPEFQNTVEFSLMDIDRSNLEKVAKLCERDIRENGLTNKITATTHRRESLKNARYIFNVVRIGGLKAFQTDIDIPLRYGVDQCVGDTLCAGGIMYGQRNIPMLLDLCRDIREVAAPNALLVNYANPMAINTWACAEYGGVNVVGLCHGVQGAANQIAIALGINVKEMSYIAAGINHQTWFIQVRHKGRDLLGKILQAFEKHKDFSRDEKVRIDMLRRFGFYSTESNGHLSEYLPWYRKRPQDLKNWINTNCWINGETGGYLRVVTESRNWFDHDFPRWMKQPALKFEAKERSHEHGSYLLEGLETGRVYRGHFNVVNRGVIKNLAPDAIIEAPGYADGNGLNIPLVGELPLGCATVCEASINVQRLAVKAAVTGDDELLRQSMLLDPLVGAVCNPPEVWQMADELLVAQAQWLPQYKKAIAAAKKTPEPGVESRSAEKLSRRRAHQNKNLGGNAQGRGSGHKKCRPSR